MSSGLIVGVPIELPSNWALLANASGYLIGPGANLANAILGFANLSGLDLIGANLTNVNLEFVNLTGANLSNANLTGVTWFDTTCPDGTNSSSYLPQTCIGHGI